MKRDADLWMVTVFGLGYLRPAPGTWGSLPSVLIAAALVAAGAGPGAHPSAWVYYSVLGLLALVFTGACIVLGEKAEARFWKKDPAQVVADETAGQAVTLLFLPSAAVATAGRAAIWLLLAFLAFRAMDILKPWPAHGIQRVEGGWGLVLDDLIAGLYAGVVLLAAALVLPK